MLLAIWAPEAEYYNLDKKCPPQAHAQMIGTHLTALFSVAVELQGKKHGW